MSPNTVVSFARFMENLILSEIPLQHASPATTALFSEQRDIASSSKLFALFAFQQELIII